MNDRASDIGAFVRRFSSWHRWASALVAALAGAVVWLALIWVVDLVVPRHVPLVASAAGGLWVAAIGLRWWRSAPSLAVADRELGMGDRLRTWASTEPGPVRAWLGRDLSDRVEALPKAPWQQRSLRRRLRPLRTLVPTLCVLIVLRTCTPGDGPVSHPEAGGGGAGGESVASAGGVGAGATGDAGEKASADGTSPPEPESPEPTPPEPETPAPDLPEPDAPDPLDPEPAVPESLIEGLAVQDDFLIPHFIGADDGADETVLGPVATVGDGSGQAGDGGEGGATPPPPRAGQTAGSAPDTANGGAPSGSQGGATGNSPDPAKDAAPEPRAAFERARERALRSRHVAPAERDLVRRYFDLLVERRGR